jgi:hypothetical protein
MALICLSSRVLRSCWWSYFLFFRRFFLFLFAIVVSTHQSVARARWAAVSTSVGAPAQAVGFHQEARTLAPRVLSVVMFFDSCLCVDCYRNLSCSYSCAIGLKSLRLSSPNCTLVVIFQTHPLGVRWNDYKDINCSSIRFLLSISHVILLASFLVSVAVPNTILRADSFSITVWS